jgi:hypothetical protein
VDAAALPFKIYAYCTLIMFFLVLWSFQGQRGCSSLFSGLQCLYSEINDIKEEK